MLVYCKHERMRNGLLLIMVLCASLRMTTTHAQNPQHQIIPAPVEYTALPGYFYFRPTTFILVHDMASFQDAIAFRDINLRLRKLPLKTLKEKVYNKSYIDVRYDSTLNIPDAGYILHIYSDSITIVGKNQGGVFYGLMTLAQMIESPFTNQFQLPCAQIRDYPQFGYRGMHLDCSRHFFSVEEVKTYIDYLALYKMNNFHWHLTDDQGWRIEIKKYPKLTEVGAWRDGSMVGHYRDQNYDDIRYGGFYTQDEIKQVIKYAQHRNINIIPEIEMPGHCRAALAAYPQYGCIADTQYTVGKAYGVYPEVFCPTEETFTFLSDILTEVIALFPSPYIHIGGDEVDHSIWQTCAHCQALMKAMNTDTKGLQSYFIQRIDSIVHAQGRTIIGWEEILDGGISPNAVVMSWRGTEGGIHAAKQGHYAIMTPGSHCYFDHYQGPQNTEPVAFGGYTPLSKVYAYDPIPAALTATEAKYILGAQGNLWSEYLIDFDQVEYMLMPRLMALSEVLWSQKATRDYSDFMRRLPRQFALLDAIGCRYSTSAYGYTANLTPAPNNAGVQIVLDTWDHKTGFTYTYATDSMQSLFGGVYRSATYTKPIIADVAGNFDIKIAATKTTPEFSLSLYFSKATGKPIKLESQPSENYPGNGAFTLVDGESDMVKPSWNGAKWLGYRGTDMSCVIDLMQIDTISSVALGTLSDIGSWIYPPKLMEVSVSTDGKKYQRIGVVEPKTASYPDQPVIYKFSPTAAKFVKITAYNFGKIPSGNPGAGQAAWLFVDELHIE